MEYEKKLSDIIASLPEVAGGFLFAPDKGLYSNQTEDIANDESLHQIGIKLTKIVSMLTVHFHDTNSITVTFRDMILYGTPIQNKHWLFLLHQPSLSPGMLKMTVQMALNIEADPTDPEQTNNTIQSSTSSTSTDDEIVTEPSMKALLAPGSELSSSLMGIKEQLTLRIGPIAEPIFRDSVEIWATNGTPSHDRITDLIVMLESEIDDEDDRNSFSNCLISNK